MASDILTLNAGSSSLKFSLWQSGTGINLRELLRGEVEKIGIEPRLSARKPTGDALIDKKFDEGGAKLTHEDLLRELFDWLSRQRRDELKAIGHRIVHGGAVFTAPVRINDQVMEKLSQLEPLAPLHQPHNLSEIRTCAVLRSRVCARCVWLGVILDERANGAGQIRVSKEGSRVRVYVIPTDEERMIAEHTVSYIA
jgi:acetate kinase